MVHGMFDLFNVLISYKSKVDEWHMYTYLILLCSPTGYLHIKVYKCTH